MMKSVPFSLLVAGAMGAAIAPTQSLAQADGHIAIGEGRNVRYPAFAHDCLRVKVWYHRRSEWVEHCVATYAYGQTGPYGSTENQIYDGTYVGNYYDHNPTK